MRAYKITKPKHRIPINIQMEKSEELKKPKIPLVFFKKVHKINGQQEQQSCRVVREV